MKRPFIQFSLLCTTMALLTGCSNRVDMASIDIKNMDNAELTEIIESTEMKKLILMEDGDDGGVGMHTCETKLVLLPNGSCEYSYGENLTDFGSNSTTSGGDFRGRWNINKNGSMFGDIQGCIGDEFEYTYLEIKLENGKKSTAVLYKDGSTLELIDCDKRVEIRSSFCEQLDEGYLIIPSGTLVSGFEF